MASSKTRAIHSDQSSSTESVNSIPPSDDDDVGPPIMLDQEIEAKKQKSKPEKPEKPPPKPERPTKLLDKPEKKKKKDKDKDKAEEGEKVKKHKKKTSSTDEEKKKKKKSEKKSKKQDSEEGDENDGKPKKPKPPKPPPPQRTISDATALIDPSDLKAKLEKTKSGGIPEEEDNEEEDNSQQAKASRWKRVVDSSSGLWTSSTSAVKSTSTNVSSSVTNSFASVVTLAKKAAIETKHKMGPAAEKIYIVHFNDVYNVDSREEEPVGGAARFLSAVKSHDFLNPMVLFSGDVFAPSIMSTFTKGEQMIPVLNKLETRCAVFGNHDFDFGIDTLMERVEKTTFPWLMSNVIDNETGRPLAEGKVFHIVEWCGRKIGLIGLVEKEWLETLSTINPEEVTFTDYVDAGQSLAKELRGKGCQFVIALTHMRTPNDVRLAENVAEIDLILGGHDHVYEKKKINGTFILKSGTDFRQFSMVTVDFTRDPPLVEIDSVDVTADFEPDNELESMLGKYSEKMELEMCKELGEFECDLDGCFSSIRTRETNLGNFVCDIMVAATNADLALLNSGTFRSDKVHTAGPFFLRDLLSILPMIDPLVLLEVTGPQIVACLENGVSQYPKLEGRFPQVSGVSFAFDPEKPKGKRIDPAFVKIGDEYVETDPKSKKRYHLVTKGYLAKGKDGYDMLADCPQLIDDENGPTLTYAVQNHFAALAMREGRTRRSSVHHQSLVTMSRKTSIVRQLTEDGTHHIPAHMPEKFQSLDISGRPKFGKQTTIVDLEQTNLKPQVEGRIKILNPKA